MHAELSVQAQTRVSELGSFLNAAIAGSLAERDLATLAEILRETGGGSGIEYLVLKEHRGPRLRRTAGIAIEHCRSKMISYETIMTTWWRDSIPVCRSLSWARSTEPCFFGLSTESIRSAETSLIQQSLIIAMVEVTLTIVLLSLIGLWLTRHLTTLTNAVQGMAKGEHLQSVPVVGRDEIGRLSAAFNAMAESVHAHITELGESEGRYRVLADTAQQEQGRMSSLLSANEHRHPF